MAIAIQNLYTEAQGHCFGCGSLHPQGLKLKSYLHGDKTIAQITPPNMFTGGVPNHLFGGLIASLLDCHGTASAAAFNLNAKNLPFTVENIERFITAHLAIDYLVPTPIDVALTLEGRLITLTERKAEVSLQLSSPTQRCATAKMVAVKLKSPASRG